MMARDIDPSGTLFDGAKVDGPVALRQMLVARPEVFVGVMHGKTADLRAGPRRLEYYDMPAVRKIVRDAGAQRFPLFIAGPGNGQERAVSDEDEARSRRTAA